MCHSKGKAPHFTNVKDYTDFLVVKENIFKFSIANINHYCSRI